MQTDKEVHIYLDARTALLNSNRVLSLRPEVKDMYLNAAAIQYIETRSSDKLNIKREGFEDTNKRLHDLRLLKERIDLEVFVDDSYGLPGVFGIVPANYHSLIPSGRSNVIYNCRRVDNTIEKVDRIYTTLPFPDDNTVGTSRYVDINFTINGTDLDLPNVAPFCTTIKTQQAKFMAINYVLSTLRSLGYEVYWEWYDNIYHRGSFIIVGKDLADNLNFTFTYADATEYDASSYISDGNPITIKRNFSKVIVPKNGITTIRENELRSSTDIIDGQMNTYMFKNRHRKPLSFITGSRIYVIHDLTFLVTGLNIEYIRKPMLFDINLNQVCELDNLEEIANIAAEKIIADVSNPQLYSVIKDSNIKSE